MKEKVNYHESAKEIIELVGGVDNILTMKHCMTRLRFVLKDETVADDEKVREVNGVFGVCHGSGQYMVIMGTTVTRYFEAAEEVLQSLNHVPEAEKKVINEARRKSVINSITEISSAIFVPMIGIMMLSKLVAGILSLLVSFGLLLPESSTYTVLYALANAVYYYMPIMVAYSASVRLGLPPLEGMVIGAALMYPTLLAGSTAARGDFLGIPIYMPSTGDYSSSILPVIAAVAFAAFFEKKIANKIPGSANILLKPFVTCTVTFIFTLLVLGPLTNGFVYLLSLLFSWLSDTGVIVYSVIVGSLWQVVLVLGLHHAVLPIVLNNFAAMGYDMTLSCTFACNFAQIGALLALYTMTKEKKERGFLLPAALSSFFGVIEPALIGVSLPRKRIFLITSLVNGLIGLGMVITGLRVYSFTGHGVMGYSAFINPDAPSAGVILLAVLWSVITVVLSFVLIRFFGKEKTALH